MATKINTHIDEFCESCCLELAQPVLAKTGLFSDYVQFCCMKYYRHHSNLVQFCKEVDALRSDSLG